MINEIESDPNPDWVEFYNRGSSTVTLTGWTVRDDDPNNTAYTFPAGTTIAPGAYFVVTVLGFGLGNGDTVSLFNNGVLADQHVYTAHASTGNSWSRCPNGTGAFAPRPPTQGAGQGAVNDCPP